MKVRFRTNLGSIDAGRIGVDYKRCTYRAEVDVSDDAGKWLVANGIADSLEKPVIVAVGKPAEIQAVPEPLAVESPPAEPDAFQKMRRHKR